MKGASVLPVIIVCFISGASLHVQNFDIYTLDFDYDVPPIDCNLTAQIKFDLPRRLAQITQGTFNNAESTDFAYQHVSASLNLNSHFQHEIPNQAIHSTQVYETNSYEYLKEQNSEGTNNVIFEMHSNAPFQTAGSSSSKSFMNNFFCLTLRLTLVQLGQLSNLGDIICDCLNNSDSRESDCAFIDIIASKMACTNPSCHSVEPPPFEKDKSVFTNEVLSLKLISLIPTPDIINSDTIKEERYSYYLAIRSLYPLYKQATDAFCGHRSETRTLFGWDLLANFYSIDRPGLEQEKRSFAALRIRPNVKDPKKKDFLLSVRGTMTLEEWILNFSYFQVTGLFKNESISVHEGFGGVALKIWKPLKKVLTFYNHSGTLGALTVTGHSLGGGIGAILGLLIATAFPHTLPNVILFGSPRVGGTEFQRELAAKTILRSIEGAFDPIASLPCSKMPACPIAFFNINNRQTSETIKLNPNVLFAPFKGRVIIRVEDLPKEWSSSNKNYFSGESWHICSYRCWTSLLANLPEDGCYPPSTGRNEYSVCSGLSAE